MRITEAARRLGTSARMLRYREELGLLPAVRDPYVFGSRRSGPARAGVRGAASGAGLARGAAGAAQAGAHGAAGAAHRQFSEEDLEAVAAALEL
ncbi:MAG TPA: MerR family DNA-binding transcriptional regulator, partial [Streptosporangiaceae bacterium]